MLRSLVLSALALSLTISLNADETKPPKPAKPKPAATKLLIPAKEGRDLLAKGVLFLDVRSKSVYLKGHIPGAQHVDVAQWTRQLKNETTRTDAKLWAKQIGQLGISKDTWVVVYGTDSAINPARAWWSLKYLGLEKVSILHEGWGMWAAWGGKIATTTRKLKTTQFVPKFQKERLALTQDVKAYHRDKKFQVLDSRSLGEYEGGRIPNSNRFEWKG
ncbi:MAG: rhodanese-like domain-containing protein, partial [Planctomycetota bacterium]